MVDFIYETKGAKNIFTTLMYLLCNFLNFVLKVYFNSADTAIKSANAYFQCFKLTNAL